MYAVIFSGGKQYRVKEGQSVRLEKLDVTAGDSIEFDKVLMVADGDNIKVGAPYLSGITVKAEVLRQGRGDKIFIIKMKRRKHYMRRTGHRQDFTEVKITGIAA
jgi:large subunit ribosomal protein L21